MFKMPSHPTVFIIVVEQGELGEGRDEKDFCFSLCFSTSSTVFLPFRKAGVQQEHWGVWGGQGPCLGPVILCCFSGYWRSLCMGLLLKGPTAKAAPCRAPRPAEPGGKCSYLVPLRVVSFKTVDVYIHFY